MNLQLTVSLGLAAALAVILAFACGSSDVMPLREQGTGLAQQSEPLQNPDMQVQKAPFRVIEWTDISVVQRRRATARVQMEVTELPDLAQIERVARLVQQEQAHAWDEITVFVYLPGMDTNSAAYGIAEFPAKGPPTFETSNAGLALTKWYEQTAEAIEAREQEQKHIERTQSGSIPSYQMALEISVDSDRTVRAECATNLPDGTLISIEVGRTYTMRGADAADEPYAQYYLERELPVAHGQVVVTVKLDDRAWKSRVEEQARKMRSLGFDMHVQSLGDEVFAGALYTSNNKHPAEVIKLLGENGQFVGGPLSERAGNGRAISVSKSIPIPLED